MPRNILLALAWLILGALSGGTSCPALAEPIPLGGKILDGQGKPLPKATVEVFPVPTFHEQHLARLQGKKPEPVATAAAGPDGRFQVAVPTPGLWQVRVEAPGFAPREYQLAPYLEPTELPEARLGTASPLKVQVLDAEGRRVAGARVAASLDLAREIRIESDWMPVERTGTTGPDGTVTLLREALEDLKVQAVAPGPSAGAEGEASPTAGTAAASAVQVRLAPACATTVEVVDRASKPVAGALVAVTRWTGGLTDAAGRLTLALPCGKEVKVHAGLADGRKVETLLGAKRVAREPVRLSLPPQPLRLAGRVLEEGTRQPVAGALVWPHDAGRAVWTDRNGAYTLTTPPSPQLLVQAASRRHSRGRAMHDPGVAGSGLQAGPSFALSPVAFAAGSVVDEAGKPVAGAEVAGFPTSRWGAPSIDGLRTRSGERGTFRLRLAPGTPHELEVTHPDFAAAEAAVPEIAAHASRTDLRVVLRKGQAATGIVVDSQDRPVAGARIVLTPLMPAGGTMSALRRAFRSDRTEEIAATSGADGRFFFSRLTPGRFNLLARAEGFGPVRVPGLEIPESSGPASLGTVILPPGVDLPGIVVDSQDRPVAGALIAQGADFPPRFRPTAQGDSRRTATTGADGRFVLSGFAAGEQTSLSVSAEGFVTRSVEGLEPPLAEPVRIALSPGARISGRVVDEQGRPVPTAMVVASQAETERMSRHANTDEAGRFSLDNLAAGSLTVRAEAPGFLPGVAGNLELAPGGHIDELEITLRGGAVVTGQILGPDGKPLSGAYVAANGRGGFSTRYSPALSDADGKYRLQGVEPGPRVLTASHSNHQQVSKDLDVQPGENRLDFRLDAGHTVAGRVADSAGEPVEGAEVMMWGRGFVPPVRSGADGSFRLANVAAGTYELSARRQGYAPGSLKEVQVAGPVDGLEVRLDRGGVIRGRITGVDFPDLGKVRIGALQADRNEQGARVDFRGDYRLEGLAAGEWEVRATVFGDGRRAEGKVALAPGGEAVLDLELASEGLTLTGRVLRQGKPVGGVGVWIRAGRRTGGGASTNHDGAFRLPGLEPGTHTLFLRSPDGPEHQQTVELNADQDVVIELPEGRVSGRVVDDADSSPLAGAAVRLEPVGEVPDPASFAFGRGLSAGTDSAGTFTLTGVAEGAYRVIARKEGYGPGESTVQVGPGASVEGIRLELSPTQGLTLQVSGPAGPPGWLTVALVDASGRTLLSGGYTVVEGGRVRVTDAPPGSWRLLATGAGSAVANAEVTVPGPTVPVFLPPAVPLRVTVPALVESPATATLRVQGTDGRPYQAFSWSGYSVTGQWPLQEGKIELPVPPGNWKLTVTASDGRTWQGSVLAAPGTPAEATLR